MKEVGTPKVGGGWLDDGGRVKGWLLTMVLMQLLATFIEFKAACICEATMACTCKGWLETGGGPWRDPNVNVEDC